MAKKRRKAKATDGCPCGGPSYADCCRPFHEGAPAPDPERLMRSRYTAFVRGDGAYVWRTLHSQHDARSGDEATFVRSIANTARRYTRLRVLDTRPPDADGAALVLFAASFTDGLRSGELVELSVFLEEDGWKYLAGEILDIPAPMIDRLDIATLHGEKR